MAIRPVDEYATQTISGDPGYPHGKAKNVVTPGDGTGTPLEAKWVNDFFGMMQAMLNSVGLTPNATPEQVGASQFLDALNTRLGGTANLEIDPLNVDFASFEQTINLSTTATQASAIAIKSDGLAIYIATSVGGTSGRGVWQFALGDRWNVSSAAYVGGKVFVPPQITSTISGLHISSDGSKMFLMDEVANIIHEYSLPTPWEVLGATYTSNTLNVTAQTSNPWGIFFGKDGTRLYVITQSGSVVQYNMSPAYDLSSAVFTGSKSLTAQFAVGRGVLVSGNGERMVCLDTGDSLWQYRLATPWTVSTAVYDGITVDLTSFDANASNLATTPTGARIYMVGGVGADQTEVNQFFANRVGITG